MTTESRPSITTMAGLLRPTTIAAMIADLSTTNNGDMDVLIDELYQVLVDNCGPKDAIKYIIDSSN